MVRQLQQYNQDESLADITIVPINNTRFDFGDYHDLSKFDDASFDLVFIIDTNRENLAVAEAKKLGVPIMAILDSNSNPDGILYPIPGNDNAVSAIAVVVRRLSDAYKAGAKEKSETTPV